MNEENKLREAQYFLSQMQAELKEPESFTFNLSAFLSAARSVAQYALNEASGKRGGRRWYDAFLGQNEIIKFFTSERDANIHTRPIQLGGHADVYVADVARFKEQVTVEKFDEAGNLVEVTSPEETDRDDYNPTPFRFVVTYKFDRWQGSEDVPTLCSRYLDALLRLVSDGQLAGYLNK